MRGRKPHPTAWKLLRGNPGKRAINREEPTHPPLDVAVPKELREPLARDEWTRIASLLILRGQVTTVDRSTLIGYCTKYGQWQALELEAERHPFIVKSPNGYPMPNPALCMANKALSLVLKAAAELGITPSARSRVSAQAPAVVSRWANDL